MDVSAATFMVWDGDNQPIQEDKKDTDPATGMFFFYSFFFSPLYLLFKLSSPGYSSMGAKTVWLI